MVDPRTYNALARVNKSITTCLNAKAARESFTSRVRVLGHPPRGFDYSDEEYPVVYTTLDGMVHTCHQSNILVNSRWAREWVAKHTMIASYGKLTKSAEDRLSFAFDVREFSVEIYADKGIITREDGPAVSLRYGIEQDINGLELYIENGKIIRACALVTTGRPEVIEVDFGASAICLCMFNVNPLGIWEFSRNIRNNIETIIDKYATNVATTQKDRLDLELLNDHVSRTNDAITILGTNIPAIFDNIDTIATAMTKIMGLDS